MNRHLGQALKYRTRFDPTGVFQIYGHIYRVAAAAAEGPGQVAGAAAELLPGSGAGSEAALQGTGAVKARAAPFGHIPVATVDYPGNADAIIIGIPTPFRNMCADATFSIKPAVYR